MTKNDCRPGCVHQGKASGEFICEYIINTGRRRPCPSGQGCTVWAGEVKTVRKPKWDVAQAKALFDAGADMRIIADTVGVKLSSLRAYASKYKWQRPEQNQQTTESEPTAPAEPKHTHTHTMEAASPGPELPPDPKPEPEPAPEQPAEVEPVGPIELTIRTSGLKMVTLTAPDGDAALALYWQLGACLDALGVPIRRKD